MTKLADALAGVARLGFDTAPVIYFVEAHPRYDALVTEVFQRVASRALDGVTSVITLTEVLVQPIRRGNIRLQQEYRDLLLRSDNFEVRPIDVSVAEVAADLRARYRLRTPDAMQAAAALAGGCQAFLTNDPLLKRVAELRVLVLDELTL
ncbi:MAG: type II toxin-antitoxin system VapC family toxin [Planctomycetes bacterium]|nr:type II toxin-antitoxin system VapC family toxin [Planctomycetota bacterium]